MEPWEAIVCDAWRTGQRLSAVGPGPVEVHLEHARSIAELIPVDASRGLDLGTGAGLPGLALAGLRPEMDWVLLDASRRRLRLVEEAVSELGWTERVQIVHGSAEAVARAGIVDPVDVVVARLFGRPAVTAECAAPFVRLGGAVLVTEPLDAEVEVRWSADGLAALGLRCGRRTSDPSVQMLDAVTPPEGRFPRQPGVCARRPLW